LFIASQHGHVGAIKLLLAAKASIIDVCNNDGASALFIASQNGHVGAMKVLLAAKASIIDVCDNSGTSALQIATKSGRVEAVKLLESQLNTSQSFTRGSPQGNGGNDLRQSTTKDLLATESTIMESFDD